MRKDEKNTIANLILLILVFVFCWLAQLICDATDKTYHYDEIEENTAQR